jgi:hypothetical protein
VQNIGISHSSKEACSQRESTPTTAPVTVFRLKGESLMNIIRKLAVRVYRKDLIEFIDTLSEFNEEKVAIVLIYSVWLRAILQIE